MHFLTSFWAHANRSSGHEYALELHCTGRGELGLVGAASGIFSAASGIFSAHASRFLGRTGRWLPWAGPFQRQSVFEPRGLFLGPSHAVVLNTVKGFWATYDMLVPHVPVLTPLTCSYAFTGISFRATVSHRRFDIIRDI